MFEFSSTFETFKVNCELIRITDDCNSLIERLLVYKSECVEILDKTI